MQEVICKIEGCCVCHEDTTYTLQFMDDGKIIMRVSGCNNWNKRWNAGFTDGREMTREEAMRLLREHADDMRRQAQYYIECREEAEEAESNALEAIASLTRMWQPALTRRELEIAAAPLLKKYPRA